MSSLSAVDTVRGFFNAVQRMDSVACAAAFTEDGVMHTPCLPSAFPRTQRGRDNIRHVFELLGAQVFTTFAWVDLEVHATDDPQLVFVRCGSRAELRDGRIYANEYACYAQVENGLLREYTEFFDTERAAEAFKHLT